MAGIQGRYAAFKNELYFSSAQISDKTEANISPDAAGTVEIVDVLEMGGIDKARVVIDLKVHGNDYDNKIVGQAESGTFTFKIIFNNDNAVHQALLSDSGEVIHTFIVTATQGENQTFAAFDGFIATANLMQEIDEATTLEIEIARSGGPTRHDKA